jgi:hypothetical protein
VSPFSPPFSPHQQAARKGLSGYSKRNAIAIADDGSFAHLGADPSVTARQLTLNARFRAAQKKNPSLQFTLKVEESIQRAAMRAGNIKDEHITIMQSISRGQLQRDGVLNPFRVPG